MGALDGPTMCFIEVAGVYFGPTVRFIEVAGLPWGFLMDQKCVSSKWLGCHGGPGAIDLT